MQECSYKIWQGGTGMGEARGGSRGGSTKRIRGESQGREGDVMGSMLT